MNTKQQKNLLYKVASGSNDKNLQAALIKAISQYPKPEKRVESLGADGSEVRFVAYARNSQQVLLGVFHKLTKGRAQEVIEMIKDGDEWPVSLVTAKTPGKEMREFVEGTLFFGVWKNHVIVHQTSSCRVDALQEHLSWLLTRFNADNADGEVPAAVMIDLADPVPAAVQKKSTVPVKEIKLGGCVATRVASAPTIAGKTVSHANVQFRPTGRIWGALMEIFQELKAPVPEDLVLRESLGENDLKVAMRLFTTKKKAESTAGEVLGAVGKSLSHSDADYTVILADNTEIKGDVMKVKRTFGVECVDHHPIHQSIFKRILECMNALVEDKTITEDEPFGNVR